MSIMMTHRLGIDECYHWSAHPLWSIPFTTGVNLGVFCRVWDHAGFFSSFPWLNWVMLFHILPLIILSTVREVRDTIALYHSKDNETSLANANHAKYPPHLTPQKTLWFVSLAQGRVSLPFINILLEFVKNIYITIYHFFKLFRQTNAMNWNDILHINVFHVNFLKYTS